MVALVKLNEEQMNSIRYDQPADDYMIVYTAEGIYVALIKRYIMRDIPGQFIVYWVKGNEEILKCSDS